MLNRIKTATSLVLGAGLTATFLTLPPEGSAVAAPSVESFNPGNIISDEVFYDFDSMTVDEIQTFLNSMVQTCRAEDPAIDCLKDIRVSIPEIAATQDGEVGPCSMISANASASAAQAIYAAATACGINPKVLIVKLQKEQGLVTSTKPTEYMYRAAMGFGCPDADPSVCGAIYTGLFNQLYRSARQLQWYGDPAGSFTYWRPGDVVSMRLNPKALCGTKSFLLENQATAAIYYYTPYTPNDAALQNLYGTGDSCSTYGNRNFWRFFNDWFGSSQSANNIVRDSSGKVYLLNGSEALEVPSADVSRLSWLGEPTDVLDSVFLGLASGDVLRSVVNQKFLLGDSGLLELADCYLAAQFGVDCDQSSTLAPGHLATLPSVGYWQAPGLGELPLLSPSILGDATVDSTIFGYFSSSVQGASVSQRWLRLQGEQQYLLSEDLDLLLSQDLVGASIVLEITSSKAGYADRVELSEPIIVRSITSLSPGGGGGGGAPAVQAPAPPVTTNLIPTGKSLAVIGTNGVALEVKSELAPDAKELSLSFGTVKLDLAAQSGASFTKEGKATISAGTNLSLSAEGYQPNSLVAGYLIPAASLTASSFNAANSAIVELGTATVDALGSFRYDAKISAPAGSYVMQLIGTSLVGEKITIALETTIQADTETKTWAKRLPGNTEAKLYAKNIVGAGKVSFRVNGKEIAWIRAQSATDPKLRVVTEGPMAGANYLVRTVKLNPGKNILEVYIDGVRTTRVAYSRK